MSETQALIEEACRACNGLDRDWAPVVAIHRLADALEAEKARADKLTGELDWYDGKLADERTAHEALRQQVAALADAWRKTTWPNSPARTCAVEVERLLASQDNQEATE